jgi:hypothetical protein
MTERRDGISNIRAGRTFGAADFTTGCHFNHVEELCGTRADAGFGDAVQDTGCSA